MRRVLVVLLVSLLVGMLAAPASHAACGLGYDETGPRP